MIAFLEARKAGLFRRSEIWRNVVSGVIVGIVALPLAMAFAIASGAQPEQGLYTAIVAGLATSLLGGTRIQTSAPSRSGPRPERGLSPPIVAGLATSILGGTRIQISGPAGAFIAVLAGITAQYGLAGLQGAKRLDGVS